MRHGDESTFSWFAPYVAMLLGETIPDDSPTDEIPRVVGDPPTQVMRITGDLVADEATQEIPAVTDEHSEQARAVDVATNRASGTLDPHDPDALARVLRALRRL